MYSYQGKGVGVGKGSYIPTIALSLMYLKTHLTDLKTGKETWTRTKQDGGSGYSLFWYNNQKELRQKNFLPS